MIYASIQSAEAELTSPPQESASRRWAQTGNQIHSRSSIPCRQPGGAVCADCRLQYEQGNSGARTARPAKPGGSEARVLQKTEGESWQRRSQRSGSGGGRVPHLDPGPLNHAQDPMGEPPKREVVSPSRSRQGAQSFDGRPIRTGQLEVQDPDVPDGDWYKDFGTFKLCGTGRFPSTFLMSGQPARGKRL